MKINLKVAASPNKMLKDLDGGAVLRLVDGGGAGHKLFMKTWEYGGIVDKGGCAGELVVLVDLADGRLCTSDPLGTVQVVHEPEISGRVES